MLRRTLLRVIGTGLALGQSRRRALAQPDPAAGSLLSLLEETARARVPAELVARIRDGLRFERLLEGLTLAAVRNVQPYPDVGFKFHAVMVLQSIHLTTHGLTPEDRWLPAVWAADYFKQTQAAERRATGWHMPPRPVVATRDPERARRALVAALEAWDRDAADAAIVGYASSGELAALWEVLFLYGARDLRAIGHKTITVQNAHRLVGLLGREDAIPILRSTVAALQNPGGDPNPARNDLPADQPWRANRERLADIPAGWRDGRADPGARAALLQALREASEDDAGALVVEQLRRGTSPVSIWEALFGAAGELILRRPGIVAVHAQTTASALNHVFRFSTDEGCQQLAMLQCAAFIAMFQGLVGGGGARLNLDALEPLALEAPADGDPVGEIFAGLWDDRGRAARKTLAYLSAGGGTDALVARARHHLAHNVRGSHDYKFAEAAFENAAHAGDQAWRGRLLAAAMGYLRGPGRGRSNRAVEEAVALLQS
jgi:hypothetical protein